MAEALRPDGLALPVGDVVLYTPGLAGTAEVHQPGATGMRAAEETTPEMVDALARNQFAEQLTVEIADPTELDSSGGTRAAAGSAAITLDAPAPGTGLGQILLYTAEDGSITWHFPDDVPRDEATVASRGGERRTYTVPRAVVPAEGGAVASRGLFGAVGKKLLKLLVFPLVDPLLGAVAEHFARKWEEKNRLNRIRVFEPGNYRVAEARELGDDDWRRLSEGPALLFVHGTMSQAHTGFQSLPEAVLAELHERYGGRVAAFDHHTISVTPTDNARFLAGRLPADVKLDLDILAHSRGGLVSRVLAERPADVGLGGRLDVRTLVMVATPNAGTALAHSTNLGKLMDRYTNILQFVPDNPVTDILDGILTVLKHLAIGAFRGLDGLTAMDPAGSYLKDLNGSVATKAVYRAVAANFEPPAGSPLLRVVRDGATDIVFGQKENDLVVPTEGVHTVPGAARFPIAEPLLFDAATGVDHSTFWARPEFEKALGSWLAPAGV